MATFRFGYFPEFDMGIDAILVGADRDGMREFRTALQSALELGHGTFELHGIQHQVVKEKGAAAIELGWQVVKWRFDDSRLEEALGKSEALIDSQTPCHHYLDELTSPVETVVLTVDEYTAGGPFAEFPQGEPLPNEENEEEVRDILRSAVRGLDDPPRRLGTRMAARFKGL